MEEETPKLAHKVSDRWRKVFDKSHREEPQYTIYHELPGVGQREAYSCGAAVLTSIINGLGVETTEDDVIQMAEDQLKLKGYEMSETGTPPDVVKNLLETQGITYEEKPSDESYEDQETLKEARQWLDTKLKDGIVMIPIQSTPDRVYHIDGKDIAESELVQEIGQEEYDRQRANGELKSEGRNTRKDVTYNGHWIAVTGAMVRNGREYYITLDPYYKNLQDEQISDQGSETSDIDPEASGVRFVDKDLLVRNWHDVSGIPDDDGNLENFNQYGLFVPTNMLVTEQASG